jgi:hypothetical protein
MFIEWSYKLSLFNSKTSFPKTESQGSSFAHLVTCDA